MKKQFGFPLMLASALAFSACSSDDVADKGSKDISALTDGGYLKMSINLPSRAANGGFRAPEEPKEQDSYVDLKDGLAKEYNVKDAILVLFQGEAGKEGEAVFHSAYKLTTSMQMDGSTQITSTTKLVQKVNIGGEGNKLPSGNTLYALVILNNNGRFAVDGNKLMYATSNLNDASSTGTTTTPTPTTVPTPAPAAETVFNGTFSDFQKITVTGGADSFRDDTKGFLMMNAPLYKTAATSSTTSSTPPSNLATLAVVTDKVKNTETAAQNEPGAEVFVERAVAKVTMDGTITEPKLKGTEYNAAHNNEVEVSLVAWSLDYMNNISYYMHNATPVTTGIADWAGFNVNGDAGSNYYRFAGATEVKTGCGYRAYWGEDPNYAAPKKTGSSDLWGSVSNYPGEKCNFIHVTIGDLSEKTGVNYPQYCMENTFNVANMNEDQTTRAIVKVKLTPKTKDADDSFYIVNNDKSKFFNLAGIKELVKTHILACNAVTTEALTSGTAAVNVNDIVLEPVVGSPNWKVTSFKVTYGTTTATTTAVVKTYDATTADVVNDVNNALSTVTKYDKGYAYYPIRIKHFGSSKALTAGGYDAGMVTWNSAIHSQTDRYNNNSDEKFLGRYGVLRNNWYDLGINSISGVGSPVIPDAPGTPDDELESFISVRINVLSWAKRVQREDL